MARTTNSFWIWGEFTSIDTDWLIEIQNKVQLKLKSPKFKIHLTLAGPFNEVNQSSIDEIRNYCGQHAPIKVNVLNYGYKEKFFQSFFIAMSQSKELDDLRSAIYKMNHGEPFQDFFPHISLAYGAHKKGIKESLVSFLPNLKSSFTMNRISIVDIGEELSLWRPSESFSFSST